MIHGIGTHSLGALPTLHQLLCKREGATVHSFPPSADRAAVERQKRRQEAEEVEYRSECEQEGATYVPTRYVVFSANADLFA